MTRETLRGLFERANLVPDRTAQHGFVVELEGRLAEMLQVVGIKKADAELLDFASCVSGRLVAGPSYQRDPTPHVTVVRPIRRHRRHCAGTGTRRHSTHFSNRTD